MTAIQKEIKEALEQYDKYGRGYALALQASAPTWLLHQQELIEQKDAEIKRLEADKISFMSNCLAAVAEVKHQAEENKALKEQINALWGMV